MTYLDSEYPHLSMERRTHLTKYRSTRSKEGRNEVPLQQVLTLGRNMTRVSVKLTTLVTKRDSSMERHTLTMSTLSRT